MIDAYRPDVSQLDSRYFRMLVFVNESPILPRFLTEVLGTSYGRKQIEEWSTGGGPMMQKITKTALMGLSIPLPGTGIQQVLVDDLTTARRRAKVKRAEAVTLDNPPGPPSSPRCSPRRRHRDL